MYRRSTPDPIALALTLGVVGSAWAFAPWAHHSFEAPKYLVLAAAGALLWWGQASLPAADPARYRRALVAAAAFGGVGLLATVGAEVPARALFGSTERAQGLLALVVLLAWSLGLARVGATHTRRLAGLDAVVWATTGVVGYALVQALAVDPLNWQRTIPGRPGSTLGNPNALAGWLALAWPTLLWGIGQPGRRLRVGGALLLALLGLWLAGSRTAWIAVALLTAWLWPWHTARARRRLALLGGGLIAFGLLAHGLGAESWRERQHLWQSAATAWAEAPPLRRLIGHGLDQQSYVLARHGAEQTPSGGRRDPDRAHHVLYDVLLPSGVLGALTLLYLAFRLARRLASARDSTWPAAPTLAVAALLYATGVPLAAELALFAGVLALGIPTQSLPTAAAPQPWTPRAVALLLGLIALPYLARSVPPQFGWPADPIHAGEHAFHRAVASWPRTPPGDCQTWAMIGAALARALASEPMRAGYQRAWRQYLDARGPCPGPDAAERGTISALGCSSPLRRAITVAPPATDRAQPKSPKRAWAIASAASPAVSVRKIRGPSRSRRTP